MGRSKDAYWASRRRNQEAASAAATRPAWMDKPPRRFDQVVILRGTRGACAVEPIEQPLRTCPGASVRVVAKWHGHVAPGEVLQAPPGRALRVLRYLPVTARRASAHFLCAPVLASEAP